MGARANYVVVDGDPWRLHYSHWGAQSVDVQLAPGPDYALRFIAGQEPCDPADGWLDDRWAEGAALVDPGRRVLLFFGASEFTGTLAYRRALFALLARTWPGWTIRWAYDELGDLVTYVGVDVAVVRVPEIVPQAARYARRPLVTASAEDVAEGWWALLTVRAADGAVTAHPVDTRYDNHLVWAGEALLGALPEGGVHEIGGRPPRWGLHVDVATGTAGWWTTDTARAAAAETPGRWPGFRLTRWDEDGYERHLAACDGAVRAPAVDLAAGFDELEANLRRSHHDPVAAALSTAETLRAAGNEVEITAPVTAHTEVGRDEAETRRLWAALAEARAEPPGEG